MKYSNRLLTLVVLLVSALASANAQKDERLASPEASFRAAISAQMAEAARNAHVTILQGPIAYAGGEGGFIVNTVIQGVERFGSEKGGTDILFVHVGSSSHVVPEGYYRVRLIGTQAQFISPNGKVAATLQAQVADPPPGAAERPKIKVKATGSWDGKNATFDVEITFGNATERSVKIVVPEKDASKTGPSSDSK